jgi:hypothetical protein
VGGLRQLWARLASISILGLELPLLLLWVGLALVLSTITEVVKDWNVMTDELVWERLAVSVGQSHSLLPRLHGEVIRSLSQLYPVLLSPFFWSGYVASDLVHAHVFNAWLMSSAAIPAFLLARRVTGRRWAAYLMALLAACTPWIVYSTVLLTEVAAYPAFLWAVLAMQKAITEPRRRNDVLLVVALAIAFLARTQFGLLFAVLPISLGLYHLVTARDGALGARLRAAARDTLRGHGVLVCVYVPLLVVGLVLKLSGHGLTHLSVYGGETTPRILSSSSAGSFTGHAADLAFGVGILPFLVGTAWLLANAVQGTASPERRSFACIGAVTTLIVIGVVAAWDLTIGQFVIDRYLFYLVPILDLATLCAVLDTRRPRWSLILPTAVVAVGFATHLQQYFLWSGQFPVSFDSPIATLYKPIADLGGGTTGASTILAVTTVALAGLFILATRLLRPATLTKVAAVLLLVAFPLDTGYTFVKLLDRDGHAYRPLTQSEAGILDWVDRTVGTDASVTQVPYPVSSAFLVNQKVWRDLEFWNKSIRYSLHYPNLDSYGDAIIWFPNNLVAFDPLTGLASRSLSPYVLQAVAESRFRISGNVQRIDPSGVMLIDAEMPWRTLWLTHGLYNDGWMRPGAVARIRVYGDPKQHGDATRTLTFQVQSPTNIASEHYTIRTNLGTTHGTAVSGNGTFISVPLCLPRHGFAEARVLAPHVGAIPGDLDSLEGSMAPRRGSLLLSNLSIADEIGAPCPPTR